MVGTVEPLKPQGNAIDQTFVANRQINFDEGTENSISSSAADPARLTLRSGQGYVVTLTTGSDEILTSKSHDLEQLQGNELGGLKRVRVEEPHFGAIEWDGPIDLSENGFDFNLVTIDGNGAEVYPEGYTPYPARGTELNMPATITLYKVDVKGKSEESRRKKIKKRSERMDGVTFVEYTENDSGGVWKFKVEHFTKYNYADDGASSEDDGRY